MNEIMNYVKPELALVSIVLYFIGMWLKRSSFIKDKYIPITLGVVGMLICGIYVASTCACDSRETTALAIFTAVTQGILAAGLSNYVNQIFKQANKLE